MTRHTVQSGNEDTNFITEGSKEFKSIYNSGILGQWDLVFGNFQVRHP